MSLNKPQLLAFLEADLQRRESRFRHRLTILLALGAAVLAIWKFVVFGPIYSIPALWAPAIGLGLVLYLAAIGPFVKRFQRLLNPPGAPTAGSSESLALRLRIIKAYGVGPGAKADLQLEALSRVFLAAFLVIAAMHYSAIHPAIAWTITAYLLVGAAGAILFSFAPLTAMRAFLGWFKQASGGTSSALLLNPATATGARVEAAGRAFLEQAQKQVSPRTWSRGFKVTAAGGWSLHWAVLGVAVFVYVQMAAAHNDLSWTRDVLVGLAASTLAIALSLWVVREAVSLASSTDRALVQQLLNQIVMGARGEDDIASRYGIVAVAQDDAMGLPSNIDTIIRDLKIDSLSINSEAIDDDIEQTVPADPSAAPALRGG